MESDAASLAQAHQKSSAGHNLNNSEHHLDLETISRPLHFVGIGGIGMSAIARILLSQGKAVSGSDKSISEITKELEELGAKIYIGHHESNVKDAGVVIVSTAITTENPELAAARAANLPVLHRSDLLSHISRSSKLIAISGTHGKTTTTGMIAQLMLDAGLKPSVVVGGIFERIGSNGVAGNGQYFVAEADESDRTHAQVTSYIAVITNVEADHLENYPGGLSQIKDVMSSFARNAERGVVICVDDAGCRSLVRNLEQNGKTIITYGRRDSQFNPIYAYETDEDGKIVAYKGDTKLGSIEMAVPGEHNKANAMAAIASCIELGLAFPVLAESLSQFKGVDRRFQRIGEVEGTIVIDDYAHHPTEVRAVLQAGRQFIKQLERNDQKKRRLVAVFQPHQPGRLRDFWDDFCTSFKDADLALIADIYVARGGNIENIDSNRFVGCMDHPTARYLPGTVAELVPQVLKQLRPNDIVLTIGAGDITKLGPLLVAELNKAKTHGSAI
ncbi:MAG TPA: UDP-N-acetylmuramate--L-alanine ligase [Oculatellaceae cyanobacterium]